jgi:hypothetical protein
MSKRVFLGFVVFLFAGAIGAQAQGLCPLNGTPNPKLVCTLPQVYGPFGLGSGSTAPLLANGHEAHFESDFLTSFAPINEAVGTQVSQLPTASPSSGITFVYDPSLKTFSPSTDENLGPILGERAGTIGRNRLYVGFSYQYFNFDSIDGHDMGKLDSVVRHEPFPPPFTPPISACPNQTGLTGPLAGNPCFVRDFIETTNDINLKVHQYTVHQAPRLLGRYSSLERADERFLKCHDRTQCRSAADCEFSWRSVPPIQSRHRSCLRQYTSQHSLSAGILR